MSAEYTNKDISQFLRAANHDLALGKYKAKDMIPDYCKAVLIGFQLQAELATANKENTEWQEQIAGHCIEIAELRSQRDTANEDKQELGREAIGQNKIACGLRDKLFEANEENERLREAFKDVRARVKEIKYHHTMPRQSRHGNTSRICEDIESRISIALEPALKGQPPSPDQ